MKDKQTLFLESMDRGMRFKVPLQTGFKPKEYMQLEKQRGEFLLKAIVIVSILVVLFLCLSPFVPQWVTITGFSGFGSLLVVLTATYLKRRPT